MLRPGSARAKLIDAAHDIVRRQGYAATSVDQICRAAGVTKGAFFHHFASKEALAVAAADQWTVRAAPLFAHPSITEHDDPLARLLAHIDLRACMLVGDAADFTCFVGTLVQENFSTSEAIRSACDASISAYCDALSTEIQAVIDVRGAPSGVTALGLAQHVQAVLQGAFILAKASASPDPARTSVAHLKRYIALLFGAADQTEICVGARKTGAVGL